MDHLNSNKFSHLKTKLNSEVKHDFLWWHIHMFAWSFNRGTITCKPSLSPSSEYDVNQSHSFTRSIWHMLKLCPHALGTWKPMPIISNSESLTLVYLNIFSVCTDAKFILRSFYSNFPDRTQLFKSCWSSGPIFLILEIDRHWLSIPIFKKGPNFPSYWVPGNHF